jgi:hypothetical protein
VRGLQSKLHGELALLAVRIEENDRRAMKRRKLVRRWIVAGIGAGVAVVDPGAVEAMLSGPFLGTALLLVGMMVAEASRSWCFCCTTKPTSRNTRTGIIIGSA